MIWLFKIHPDHILFFESVVASILFRNGNSYILYNWTKIIIQFHIMIEYNAQRYLFKQEVPFWNEQNS